MKSEAIRCAIKLYSEPTLLARFNDPLRQLPRGITELLRIVSSEAALKKISEHNNIHPYRLKTVLIHYIQSVLLQEENSDLRKLGLSNSADSTQRKLHYKLLMNIFHPDKGNTEDTPHYYTQLIVKAYKNIQKKTPSPIPAKKTFSHPPPQKMNKFQTNNISNTHYKWRDSAIALKKRLTNSVLTLFLIIIFTIIFLLFNSSSSQITIKKPVETNPSSADKKTQSN